jgi:hypothetical protein
MCGLMTLARERPALHLALVTRRAGLAYVHIRLATYQLRLTGHRRRFCGIGVHQFRVIGFDNLDTDTLAITLLFRRWLRDQGPALGAAGGIGNITHDHAFAVAVEAHAEQQVLLVDARGLEEVGYGKTAHQLADVIHVIGIGSDVVALGPRRPHGLE